MRPIAKRVSQLPGHFGIGDPQCCFFCPLRFWVDCTRCLEGIYAYQPLSKISPPRAFHVTRHMPVAKLRCASMKITKRVKPTSYRKMITLPRQRSEWGFTFTPLGACRPPTKSKQTVACSRSHWVTAGHSGSRRVTVGHCETCGCGPLRKKIVVNLR